MNAYMTLKDMDPTNHHIFSYVNQEYFYKGLERAKAEKLYIDENGRVDLGKLIQALWGTFADGKYIIIPDHSDRGKVIDFIKHIDDKAVEIDEEECHCGHCELERERDRMAVEAVAEKIVENGIVHNAIEVMEGMMEPETVEQVNKEVEEILNKPKRKSKAKAIIQEMNNIADDEEIAKQ